jgi:hypothetical protein
VKIELKSAEEGGRKVWDGREAEKRRREEIKEGKENDRVQSSGVKISGSEGNEC